ncbi:P-loop containing nucleoside triphosphate hydrolase protein [Daldinia sp. FL1419]|nr:P-loop containing nucleoside triphosphate hydrolase protein [Daldinia sp. FL1419]
MGDRIISTEERVKNLETILLIFIESQLTTFQQIPDEISKTREVILTLLEGNQSIVSPSPAPGPGGYTGNSEGSTLTVHSELPGDNSHSEQSSNMTVYGTEVSDQAISEAKAQSETKIEELNAQIIEEFKAELEEQRRRNRSLVQSIRDIQGNIRVLCRIRPPSNGTPQEDLVDWGPQEKGDTSQYWGKIKIPTFRTNVQGSRVPGPPKIYDFERIFSPTDTNLDIFNHVKDLFKSAMEGQRILLFGYGQTGSGKTYTLGNLDATGGDEHGLIPRAMGLLFVIQERDKSEFQYEFTLGIIEVYQNKSFDLLQASRDKFRGEHVRIGTNQKLRLENWDKALELIVESFKYRATSETSGNSASSRSHLIVSIEIKRTALNGETRTGTLNIVDLAGSERPNAMGLTGDLHREGTEINASLMSLNKLITSLGKGEPVVYDTELLRVLRPSITTGTKIVMFVMVSPLKKDQETSFQTLDRGQEAASARVNRVGSTLGGVGRGRGVSPAGAGPSSRGGPSRGTSRGGPLSRGGLSRGR